MRAHIKIGQQLHKDTKSVKYAKNSGCIFYKEAEDENNWIVYLIAVDREDLSLFFDLGSEKHDLEWVKKPRIVTGKDYYDAIVKVTINP